MRERHGKRHSLIRRRNGVYYLDPGHLEREIELVMHPEPVRPSMPLKEVGYFLGTVLVGLGVLLGMLVVCGLTACFWVLGKIWRSWK